MSDRMSEQCCFWTFFYKKKENIFKTPPLVEKCVTALLIVRFADSHDEQCERECY